MDVRCFCATVSVNFLLWPNSNTFFFLFFFFAVTYLESKVFQHFAYIQIQLCDKWHARNIHRYTYRLMKIRKGNKFHRMSTIVISFRKKFQQINTFASLVSQWALFANFTSSKVRWWQTDDRHQHQRWLSIYTESGLLFTFEYLVFSNADPIHTHTTKHTDICNWQRR